MNSAMLAPRFFGSGEDGQLFGLYHPPLGVTLRDVGVVLCYPGPQEYSHVHWAFQKLAGLLASAGFHVLRFDYSGFGDSYGRSEDVTLARWVEDIGTAVEELRDVGAIRRVSLVGMRLGAALVMRATASKAKIRDVVACGYDGIQVAKYVSMLDALEDARLRRARYPESNAHIPGELLGYAFPDRLRQETAAVDLLSEEIGKVSRLLLIGATLSPLQRRFGERLASAGVNVTTELVDDPSMSANERDPSVTLLSHNIPVAITKFLSRAER
ncbi:MAG: alpha/beta hydrolase family protein [Gemmatimonadaceae bacterium]|nr:alpha/beta hydrolase family protein [Gemmatimonadaceae bacterium]